MSVEKELDYNDLFRITRELRALMEEKKSTIKEKYLHRVDYMMIKLKQLMIVNRKITDYWRRFKQQTLKRKDIDEFHLFTEMFFCISAKFIDLFFEGLMGIHSIKKEPEGCRKIKDIRNNLIEHSHNRNRPLEDEICTFGYSVRGGPFLRPNKSKRLKQVSYFQHKESLIKEMHIQISNALREL